MLILSIKKENQSQPLNIVFVFADDQRAIKDKQYKLIKYNVDGEKHTQLFDLLKDPLERNSFSNKQNYQEIFKSLIH